MRLARYLTAFPVLLLAAGGAPAQARDGEWVSYRDAYRAMVVFEKYGGAKSLIQDELQVVPAEKGAGADDLQLTLASGSTQLHLPLDATGRTLFPLHKAAYDENAALVLSRKGGQFRVRPRVSILVRPDGVYAAGELRAACEQALGYARHVDPSARRMHCAGVRFVFPKKGAETDARVRKADGAELALPMVEGVAFPGDVDASFPTVTYRFGADERARMVTFNAPLAIVPVFE
jgi:hypothetical protein